MGAKLSLLSSDLVMYLKQTEESTVNFFENKRIQQSVWLWNRYTKYFPIIIHLLIFPAYWNLFKDISQGYRISFRMMRWNFFHFSIFLIFLHPWHWGQCLVHIKCFTNVWLNWTVLHLWLLIKLLGNDAKREITSQFLYEIKFSFVEWTCSSPKLG